MSTTNSIQRNQIKTAIINWLNYYPAYRIKYNPMHEIAEDIYHKAIAPFLNPNLEFHEPTEPPKRVEGEDFSVDVFILDEDGVHGLAFWNFDNKTWSFHTDTLVDYNERGNETKWKWYYPPYGLNEVFGNDQK